jgi:hypothetical protein
MKKQFLLIATLAISTITFAQVKPSFGVRAGLSSAGIRGDAANNLKSVLDFSNGMVTTSDNNGYFAGLYATIPVATMITVEPAIYYSQKGYQMVGEFGVKGMEFIGASAKAKLTTNYIDIPVLLKANMDGFQFFAGPQMSYLMSADLKTTAGVLGINLLNKTLDATQQFNRWDAAVTAGVGYQMTNGINLMASYEHGLSKLDANKNTDSYNRSFKVGLGISF